MNSYLYMCKMTPPLVKCAVEKCKQIWWIYTDTYRLSGYIVHIWMSGTD